jgi:hypothetical protein
MPRRALTGMQHTIAPAAGARLHRALLARTRGDRARTPPAGRAAGPPAPPAASRLHARVLAAAHAS